MLGGSSQNCIVTIERRCLPGKGKKRVIKKYKKSAFLPFIKELYVYLLAKEKKLDYIPKLLDFNLEERTLYIENVGISISDLCKKRKCDKESFLPEIKKMYEKLISHGLYHNDIGWKNILYNERQDRFYLIDFEWALPILKNQVRAKNILKRIYQKNAKPKKRTQPKKRTNKRTKPKKRTNKRINKRTQPKKRTNKRINKRTRPKKRTNKRTNKRF